MKNQKNTNKWDKLWIKRALILAFMDVLILFASYFCALWIRFDFVFHSIPKEYLYGYFMSMPFCIISALIIFYCFRLYHSIWRFASISELGRIMGAYIVFFVIYLAGNMVMKTAMPLSYYFIGWLLSFAAVTAMRFSYRLLRFARSSVSQKNGTVKIMIIGGGQAGRTLIHEIVSSDHMHGQVCCVIDDNANKKGRILEGIPIVGNRYDIPDMVAKYNISRIIFAIPTLAGASKKEVLHIAQETGCELQTVPGIYQLVNGEVSISTLRHVEIEDLLGRDSVKVDLSEIYDSIRGKRIMVTGGGGSIGSELCRQIVKGSPALLIIFDIYENNAYDIQQELKRKYPEMHIETLIGSVRNTNRVNWVMEHYHPEYIFHAAAHKHVPLMEQSPNEAIKNNVFGTYKLARAAAAYGVKRMLLISTDKAVNPTNIMGASKRLCEMVVQMMNRLSETEFVAVRFGNVLGSNGSVIPLFKKQIAQGGPVTVTDPNIIRYFMTIPEAVSLVLQAATYANGGEIFVLDMGEPVRIDDMARNLIRLSGYEPDVDIPIVYTGLRPGEKLFEELLMDEEGLKETKNKMIHIGMPIQMDDEKFQQQLETLETVCKSESEETKKIVAEIVPTYHPQF